MCTFRLNHYSNEYKFITYMHIEVHVKIDHILTVLQQYNQNTYSLSKILDPFG